jgi:hypothetical protein
MARYVDQREDKATSRWLAQAHSESLRSLTSFVSLIDCHPRCLTASLEICRLTSMQQLMSGPMESQVASDWLLNATGDDTVSLPVEDTSREEADDS